MAQWLQTSWIPETKNRVHAPRVAETSAAATAAASIAYTVGICACARARKRGRFPGLAGGDNERARSE